MSYKNHVQRWVQHETLDAELKGLLEGKLSNEKELEDAFYKTLEFGTGGMRGELGPGINRMNIYTIRKAALGFAQYIASFGEEAKKRGVVIAYDSRYNSDVFAMESAKAMATIGVQAYVFHELRPTPELSFAVRELNAFGGIVITASHNPPEYNGFKVYGEDGAQHPPVEADRIIDYVNAIEDELLIEVGSEEELKAKGLIKIIGEEIDAAYLEQLKTVTFVEDTKTIDQDVKIVFTPLHGTAYTVAPAALKNLGYNNVYTVKEQCVPDTNFTTVKSPNPEEHAAFEYAIKLGTEVDADVLIATDPDADRLGIAAKDANGEYVILTGNQTGGLFLHYILSQLKEQGKLPTNGVMLKTIVTSEFGAKVADAFDVETIDVLTGFKFIAERIREFEATGEKTFLFGYEESYGYLVKPFARDKDAIQAVVLAAEVAAYYKAKGMTLIDGLMEAYEIYGCYLEGLHSVTLKGKEGSEQIQGILKYFRENPLKELDGHAVVASEDYKTSVRVDSATGAQSTIDLPKSNVLKYVLADGSWVCLRPSGTEPKIKFYFGVNGENVKATKEKLEAVKAAFLCEVEVALKVAQA